jgi:protein involved in polysaccharide export with SLBB domain
MITRNKTMVLKSKKIRPLAATVVALCFVGSLTGCTALTRPIDGIPAKRLPPQYFDGEKAGLIPIDISLLGQEEPRNYTLDEGDILGVTVEGFLPYSTPDDVPPLPPVHFPTEDSTLPPSTGFPITILDDGTITLPLLKPISVKGLTLDQVRDKIRQSYIDGGVVKQDKELAPIVTLMRKRQVNVTVIRQDNSGSSAALQGVQQGRTGRLGTEYSSTGRVVKLDAYENDVLHALMETGGLPGVSAKNEVKIIRSNNADKKARMEFMMRYSDLVASYCNDPCNCPPPLPDDPTIIKIPLRYAAGQFPTIAQQDVILKDGDIVLIETRDTEFYFTGGLLPGGQWPIPRDYDLDALGAMAVVGYNLQSGGQGGGLGGLGGASQVVPPGRLYILRPTCKGQVAIEVDLAKALNDPRQRPLVQPGDTLILQYKPCEEVLNFGIGSFFTFGIRQLFRQ